MTMEKAILVDKQRNYILFELSLINFVHDMSLSGKSDF